MKKMIYGIAGILLIACGCKKDKMTVNPAGIASVTVINAIPDVSTALLKFTNASVSYAFDVATVPYQSSMEFPNIAGTLPLFVVSSADTLHSLYSGQINQKKNGIYSFYLFGQASSVQTMFVEDQIPAHRDSISGVRFVNLSAANQPFSIVLHGNPATQTEFAGVSFKQVTPFKNYSANTAALAQGAYNFDILDNSGNVVASFSWANSPFRNYTLVISGSPADGSLTVFQVNNY